MVKVSIEGRAGKSLGKKWKLHVGTVGEAINAIRANVGERFASQMGLMSHYVLVVDGALIPNESWFFKKIKQNLNPYDVITLTYPYNKNFRHFEKIVVLSNTEHLRELCNQISKSNKSDLNTSCFAV